MSYHMYGSVEQLGQTVQTAHFRFNAAFVLHLKIISQSSTGSWDTLRPRGGFRFKDFLALHWVPVVMIYLGTTKVKSECERSPKP